MTDSEPSIVSKPRNPRRVGIGTLIAVSLLSSLVSGVLGFFLAHRHGIAELLSVQDQTAGGEKYQCPMHPSIIQDHPGDCPICGMKLVKVATPLVANSSNPASAASGERKILFYRSPMDPKQTSPTPRKDEMGMDYVPVYADDTTDSEPPVAGLSAVDIDPTRQQLIGLTTAVATTGKVGGAWRTVGRVVVDETRVHHVNIKVGGFVERIYVDFVGKQVYRGTPLFSMYSPELLAAQDEYLLALRNRGILGGANDESDAGIDTLVNAAKRKLSLWDVPEKTLEQIARTKQPNKTITFHSPAAGVITKKDIVQGMRLEAGAMPYEIVDLSSVWVVADVYESELRFVKEGMPATFTLNAFPNREFKGKAVFIDPMLDPMTRTVKVRLTFPNPARELKPEMFGEVVLNGSPREGLTIPTDAVIESGTSQVVFVAVGSGKFQPRVVKLGDSNGDVVEVTSGLNPGERVVTRANFLIDSESRLRASLAALAEDASKAHPESARVLPAAESKPLPEPSSVTSSMPAPAPKRPVMPKSNVKHDTSSTHEGHEGHGAHGAHSP